MTTPSATASDPLVTAIGAAVATFERDGDGARLLAALQETAASADVSSLTEAAAMFGDRPEIAGPLWERVVELAPNDGRALVALANAYWLHGRGGEVVGELAGRAIAADPANRAGWHLWALSESDVRARVARWQQVTDRFPEDDLARALLADNAASLAGAESDPRALALAIRTYEGLVESATRPEQRAALEHALGTLRSWTL
jgi:hypothetical protein